MSANVVNQVAFLRTSRNFPENIPELVVQLSKSYIDTSNAVNARTIGIFPTNRPAITGESWYFNKNQKQQSLRQMYTFTTLTAITHGIIFGATFDEIDRFTRTFGEYTDGTNWYGLIPGSNVAIAGQVSFYVTPTQIIFLSGVGAPAVTNGNVVLEWLSDT